MLTCYDFRNRKAREAWGCQATEDQNRKLNKRVRFNWNRNLEERVKFRYQVARPLTPFQFARSEIVPHIDLLKVAKTTKLKTALQVCAGVRFQEKQTPSKIRARGLL